MSDLHLVDTEAAVQDRTARNVRVLLAYTSARTTTVYKPLGLSSTTWGNRLNGSTPFTAWELIQVCRAFSPYRIGVEELTGLTSAQLLALVESRSPETSPPSPKSRKAVRRRQHKRQSGWRTGIPLKVVAA